MTRTELVLLLTLAVLAIPVAGCVLVPIYHRLLLRRLPEQLRPLARHLDGTCNRLSCPYSHHTGGTP